MTADIKQIDFMIRDQEGKGKMVAGGDADCLHTLELATKVMVIENANKKFGSVPLFPLISLL